MSQLLNPESKRPLLDQFLGKPLNAVPTPALIIDRKIFADNCAKMHKRAKDWNIRFRAHLKTHKTAEGTRLQLSSSEGRTHAVVVSTLMEAWGVVRAGLVSDGTVRDILYGLPVGVNKVADLSNLWLELDKFGATVRLLVDHPDQVAFLNKFEADQGRSRRWSVFVKINGGQNRAGLSPSSPECVQLVEDIISSPFVQLYGFYAHAGNAYASTSLPEATQHLSEEVDSVNSMAKLTMRIVNTKEKLSTNEDAISLPLVLSVGSTPTAHAVTPHALAIIGELHGEIELHAGNYPMLDLQQQHTTLIDQPQISQRVRATVISYYVGRGAGGTDEALVDAGAIAFSKDTGPSGIYGEVVGRSWKLTRMSQEHGILTRKDESKDPLALGTTVDIIGQHACLIAAAHPWYYIVDSDVDGGETIVDIWVGWKGW